MVRSNIRNSFERSKIAITGATGFIGSELTRRLVESGHDVQILERGSQSVGKIDRVNSSVVNLEKPGSIASAIDGVGVVIHLAGVGSPSSPISDFHEIVTTNVIGTQSILEAASLVRARRVVVISSSAVYGSINSHILREDNAVFPVSVYGTTKLAAEKIANAYSATTNLETVCLRPFNLFGPNQWKPSQRHLLIPQIIRRMLANEPITIRGNGTQTRDYIHVHDLLDAIEVAALQPRNLNSVINVGTGLSVSVNDIVGMVSQRLSMQPRIEKVDTVPGEIAHVIADITLLKSSLGITPSRSLSDFIEEMTDEDLNQFTQR